MALLLDASTLKKEAHLHERGSHMRLKTYRSCLKGRFSREVSTPAEIVHTCCSKVVKHTLSNMEHSTKVYI